MHDVLYICRQNQNQVNVILLEVLKELAQSGRQNMFCKNVEHPQFFSIVLSCA